MVTIALSEAQNRLSTLLEQVEDRGEVVLIYRGEQPVAELRPVRRDRLPMDPKLSQVKFHEDPAAPLDVGIGQEPNRTSVNAVATAPRRSL